MSQLPLIRTSADLPTLMPRWKSEIDPVLTNLILNGVQVSNVLLNTVPTVIPHTLGQTPVGWLLADLSASAIVHRVAPMTSKTVTLQATAPCTISLWVY